MSADMLHTEMQKCMDELDVLQGRARRNVKSSVKMIPQYVDYEKQSHVKSTVTKPDVDDEELGQWGDHKSDKRSSHLERQEHMRPKRVSDREQVSEKPTSNPRRKEVKKRGVVKPKMKFVDLAENLWQVTSEDQLRTLLYETLSSGSFLGNMSEKVRVVMGDFIDHVIEDSGQLVANLADGPDPKDSDMAIYGISMFVSTEHLRLRGLRELIREEMLVFVEFFESTALDELFTDPSSDKHLLFLEYYSLLSQPDYEGHNKSIAMTLRVIGVDIARKMLVLATHLVEIVVALGAYNELKSQ